jgi:MerR HTH family regulatory protein
MKTVNDSMTVGGLAKQAGVKIDTIRYYERHGLLPKPPRTDSGYRTFTQASVERLRFIKQAQALGFTLSHPGLCELSIEQSSGAPEGLANVKR